MPNCGTVVVDAPNCEALVVAGVPNCGAVVVGVPNCGAVVVGVPNCGAVAVSVLNCGVVVVGAPNIVAGAALLFIVPKTAVLPVLLVPAVVTAVTVVLPLLAPNTNRGLLVDVAEVVVVDVPNENVGTVDNPNAGVAVAFTPNELLAAVEVLDVKPKDLFAACGSDVG